MSRSERAHYTRTPASWIAGCSDVGTRHRTNQDAFCIAVRESPGRAALIAVADGVSSAAGSELASLVATETVIATLVEKLSAGTPENVAFVQSFVEANRAVLGARVGDEPAACTLIAAQVSPESVSIANVGDSRAYWVGDDGSCRLLSTDDSMAQARIMLGMSRDDAEQSSHAHAITKWLGRSATNVTPSVTTFQPATDGWLLLCTDGLWNYASSPEAMCGLVSAHTATDPRPEAVAEGLVAWANEAGGKDNITAVVARLQVAPPR
ncbi:PP2C family protein-serine/threonine phosphatase [Tessaracoccus oleiagri]|uniref:Serine/threonine protein phosphatase PrpC n=1 Tax=Tessaracoccus oleiagri TaxID=686624 RepID=A0A1G9MM25_9ACTN|nr:PP2C family protein-serine/threonine phosphatase [Tessaracoccus oleiagri]SDL75081.1 Serine/threonine protein phosphatase PrpC [Tessaracoccus oleiagri]